MAMSRQLISVSLPNAFAGYCQRAQVDESEMTRTQMGTHNRIDRKFAVLRTPCAIPPRNNNSNNPGQSLFCEILSEQLKCGFRDTRKYTAYFNIGLRFKL
jgi:hypothetical protein